MEAGEMNMVRLKLWGRGVPRVACLPVPVAPCFGAFIAQHTSKLGDPGKVVGLGHLPAEDIGRLQLGIAKWKEDEETFYE